VNLLDVLVRRALVPLAVRVVELVLDRVEQQRASSSSSVPHYYRSFRHDDGTWTTDDHCAYCPRVDPLHRLYTDPPCRRH
jgi:hypothetical protein